MNDPMSNNQTADRPDMVFQDADSQSITHERWSRWNVGRVKLFGIFVHFKFFVLLLFELTVVTTAIYYGFYKVSIVEPQAEQWMFIKSLFAAGPIVLCFAGLGLYSSRQTLKINDVLLRYLVATLIAMPILWATHQLVQAYATASDFLVPVMLAIVLLAFVRVMLRHLLDSELLMRRVLVVGSGKKASFLEDIANAPDQRGFSIIPVNPRFTMADGSRSLAKTVRRHRINEVVVAFDDRRNSLPATELLDCKLSGVHVIDVLDFLERETGLIQFQHLQPSWLIFTDGFTRNLFTQMVKRSFDLLVSLLLIVLALPLILLASLAIKLDRQSPGPVFYKQKRVGLNNTEFNVYKFRSMRTDAEQNGHAQWAIQNDTRVTAVGSVLRKYRIDEIPQLFNVLMGNMSLVGPRPERPVFVKELCKKNPLYTERHRVKPGLTGWAQLRFPYTDNQDDSIRKLQYDMYYLKNQGFFFDFFIVLQTIEVVLFGKGAR